MDFSYPHEEDVRETRLFETTQLLRSNLVPDGTAATPSPWRKKTFCRQWSYMNFTEKLKRHTRIDVQTATVKPLLVAFLERKCRCRP